MVKKMTKLSLLFSLMILLTGCTGLLLSPVPGLFYTEVDAPSGRLQAHLEPIAHGKVGKSSCESFLGLIAVGNCSIASAMDNGQISKMESEVIKMKIKVFLKN